MDDEIDYTIKHTTAWSMLVHWFRFSETWILIIQPILVGAITVAAITLAVVYGPRAWAWVHEHARLMAVLETVGDIICTVLLGAVVLFGLWVIGMLVFLVCETIRNEFP